MNQSNYSKQQLEILNLLYELKQSTKEELSQKLDISDIELYQLVMSLVQNKQVYQEYSYLYLTPYGKATVESNRKEKKQKEEEQKRYKQHFNQLSAMNNNFDEINNSLKKEYIARIKGDKLNTRIAIASLLISIVSILVSIFL